MEYWAMNLETNNNFERLNEFSTTMESGAVSIESALPEVERQSQPIGFEDMNPSSVELMHPESSESFGRLEDRETVEKTADCIASDSRLSAENWSGLSVQERLDALNDVEKKIAEVQHRKPTAVVLENIESGALGYQDYQNRRIVINAAAIDNPANHRVIIDTLVHEGRHAYQFSNIYEQTVHESDSEVRSWAENYHSQEFQYHTFNHQSMYVQQPDGSFRQQSDFRLYYYQPVEIDARNFAGDVIQQLENKGMI